MIIEMEKESKITNYSIIKLIGKGAFSLVFLAKKESEKDETIFYALKKMNKFFILKEKQINHIKEEKSILSIIEHPFIVKMFSSFNLD